MERPFFGGYGDNGAGDSGEAGGLGPDAAANHRGALRAVYVIRQRETRKLPTAWLLAAGRLIPRIRHNGENK